MPGAARRAARRGVRPSSSCPSPAPGHDRERPGKTHAQRRPRRILALGGGFAPDAAGARRRRGRGCGCGGECGREPLDAGLGEHPVDGEVRRARPAGESVRERTLGREGAAQVEPSARIEHEWRRFPAESLPPSGVLARRRKLGRRRDLGRRHALDQSASTEGPEPFLERGMGDEQRDDGRARLVRSNARARRVRAARTLALRHEARSRETRQVRADVPGRLLSAGDRECPSHAAVAAGIECRESGSEMLVEGRDPALRAGARQQTVLDLPDRIRVGAHAVPPSAPPSSCEAPRTIEAGGRSWKTPQPGACDTARPRRNR